MIKIKSYVNLAWTEKSAGQEKQKIEPMYIDFNNECIKNFSDNSYAPRKSFGFGNIKVDPKTKDELSEVDKEFSSKLGIQEYNSFVERLLYHSEPTNQVLNWSKFRSIIAGTIKSFEKF